MHHTLESAGLSHMLITIIGSGTCVPSARRSSPGCILQTDTTTVLLDSGPGTLRQLIKAGISPLDIDCIAYSHFHLDHTADMMPFLFSSKYAPGFIRERDIAVIGPPGIKNLFDKLAEAYGPWSRPERFAVHWIELSDASCELGEITVRAAETRHADPSIALRVDSRTANTSFVYSGDTDYTPALVELARDADLALFECSFPDARKVEGHLTPTLAGKIASEAGCRKLVLTHMYPQCDDDDLLAPVKAAYAGEAVIAEDLMQISF